MKIIISLLIVLYCSSLFAQNTDESVLTPVITTEVDKEENKEFNPRKGHWLTSFGFEGFSYELPFSFVGEKKKFKTEDREQYGGRLGLGREFYLGGNVMISTRVEGFYVGNLFESVKSANPEVDTEFAYSKKTGQIFGGEIVQTLGLIFDMKSKNPFLNEMTYLTFEPFIEAGIGKARSYQRVNYHYDTGAAAGDTQVQEDYRHRIEDDITTARIGLGLNLTSITGYFFYLRASRYNYDITKRDEKKTVKQDDLASETTRISSKGAKQEINVFSLGGGYKF